LHPRKTRLGGVALETQGGMQRKCEMSKSRASRLRRTVSGLDERENMLATPRAARESDPRLGGIAPTGRCAFATVGIPIVGQRAGIFLGALTTGARHLAD
jgi:hypothetical protein